MDRRKFLKLTMAGAAAAVIPLPDFPATSQEGDILKKLAENIRIYAWGCPPDKPYQSHVRAFHDIQFFHKENEVRMEAKMEMDMPLVIYRVRLEANFEDILDGQFYSVDISHELLDLPISLKTGDMFTLSWNLTC